MTDRNYFTPFLVVDNPGPEGSEHLQFDGEGKRRAEISPGRFAIGFLIIVGFFTMFAAAALSAPRLVELNERYRLEDLRV